MRVPIGIYQGTVGPPGHLSRYSEIYWSPLGILIDTKLYESPGVFIIEQWSPQGIYQGTVSYMGAPWAFL